MGKSSKDKRDAYYRLAKEQNWRARSAFKLIQIDEQFDLFAHSDPDSVTRVVDLCAAPGSWSQVLSRVLIRGEAFGRRAWEAKRKQQIKALNRCEQQKDKADEEEEEEEEEVAALKPRKNVRIVAIDLQPMAPLEGITTLKADITHPSTIPLLLKALDPDLYTDIENENLQHPSPLRPHPHPVDLVLSDGAPDVTGLHDLDIYIQSQLLYAALNLAIGVLRPGGKFVAKIFRGRDVDLIYAQLKSVFESVSVAKPRSSRASSLEAFVVCEGFMPPVDEKSGESRMGLDNPIFGGGARSDVPTALGTSEMDGMRWIPPFIACGDLSAWDADASYELPPDHVSLDPVQPPTAPPYKRALELRKAKGGAYGKTKGVVYDV
ncbi:tRNA (uridine-2'-O-)-methyltransferase trm7 [Ophidiomyces ophidiicola]|uniref:tRNA (Uridine-2'-O-)-methyltransferase trm7 n=1 Tax=Ophidiomyces ophidiicola TaxID=1387563 RepID=A0ACB8V345_9EURO|nr:tRNA (uridine-2'-O-)-methyltransferase trm7 [Ophidiomyces ophidiicola]KAI1954644.1 tRNA (uridine-2'-O-)-methyltransferase trm7 [Ophidiomyces ophidiicola]KAI1958544.1 tRNA (uridine-2'-O-)-methyltransferase trm7 [Ophidiomyces ophidiicola]KAI2000560.1 tRNA (uridine-2'-O-)-methyltransferase trm7 [Ophidiomyces ophidiicola]KAI2018012.1 tRNA (uridine-2'-O-)-methyltransferase trm7 [Ophidiomyces ophidiicola]